MPYKDKESRKLRDHQRRTPELRAKEAERHRSRRQTHPMRFVAFDGEGSEGRYQLLACSATDQVLKAREGLSTKQCLWYFAKLRMENIIRRNDCLVGFGLSYDFENMLKDVPDEDMAKLDKGQTVRYAGFWLRYIRHKYLDIGWAVQGERYSLRLQDVFSYFQQSFIKACAERNIALPEIVIEGKAKRSSFVYDDIESIMVYNRAELDAMVQLAQSLYDDFASAFSALELHIPMNRMTFYGPGAQAGPVLRAIGYLEDFVIQSTQVMQGYMLQSLAMLPTSPAVVRAVRSVSYDPFTHAYFGGRIEAAVQGRLRTRLYDYDLVSAYPYAMTLLPALTDARLVEIHDLDVAERIAIYHLRWEHRRHREVAYHPFPYRTVGGNVFYPPRGEGWILSPEVLAVDRFEYAIEVLQGFAFEGTEGFGGGRRPGTSQTAMAVKALGLARAELKAEGNPAHRGLKLVLNSLYGKTLQQVGAHRYYNAFVAAWITSITRARLYEAIKWTRPGVVISTMTDGILSAKRLDLELGTQFGQWELTEHPGGIQFVPGIYVLNRTGDIPLVRYRGYSSFDVKEALSALESRQPWRTISQVFVTRGLAQHVRELADKRYYFVPHTKTDTFTLASKRDMKRAMVLPYGALYYPPKSLGLDWISMPYQGVLVDATEDGVIMGQALDNPVAGE